MTRPRGRPQTGFYWLLRVPGGTRYWDSGTTATQAATECLGAPYVGLYVKQLSTRRDLKSATALTKAINDCEGWTGFRTRPDGLLEEVPGLTRPPGTTSEEHSWLFRNQAHE